MRDYRSELFAERGSYFVVVGDLSIVEGYKLAGGNAWFLLGQLGNEPEKTPGDLRALTRLYPSNRVLFVVVCYCFCNL